MNFDFFRHKHEIDAISPLYNELAIKLMDLADNPPTDDNDMRVINLKNWFNSEKFKGNRDDFLKYVTKKSKGNSSRENFQWGVYMVKYGISFPTSLEREQRDLEIKKQVEIDNKISELKSKLQYYQPSSLTFNHELFIQDIGIILQELQVLCENDDEKRAKLLSDNGLLEILTEIYTNH